MSKEVSRWVESLRSDPSPGTADLEQSTQAYSSVHSAGNARQEIMLELRLKNGNFKGLAYAFLVAVDFNPSQGITLEFSDRKVRLIGKHLRPLFRGLLAHKVAYVQEADELRDELQGKNGPVVVKVEVEGVGTAGWP